MNYIQLLVVVTKYTITCSSMNMNFQIHRCRSNNTWYCKPTYTEFEPGISAHYNCIPDSNTDSNFLHSSLWVECSNLWTTWQLFGCFICSAPLPNTFRHHLVLCWVFLGTVLSKRTHSLSSVFGALKWNTPSSSPMPVICVTLKTSISI